MDNRSECFVEWYKAQQCVYQQLAEEVLRRIKYNIPNEILITSSCRAKELNSALVKYNTMIPDSDGKLICKYNDYKTEIMDYAGVRIVTYLLPDVVEIGRLVESLFVVDEENSFNKVSRLEPDEVGYLAQHYIVKLRDEDCEIGTAQKFAGLKCEIQIKTVLQDAWAQIFHDRQYKPTDAYPQELLRRTNLVAGALEMIDNDITELVSQYDQGKSLAKIKMNIYELFNRTIDENSLKEYAYFKFENETIPFVNPDLIIRILTDLGYKRIGHIDNGLDVRLVDEIRDTFKSYLMSIDRFYLFLCVCDKPDDFFQKSGCSEISQVSFDMLKRVKDIQPFIDKYNVHIV